ncbi:NAD-dependent epimerase/dehydratase family protein [Vibrio sp.]|nr:NAD-dependent epimerase/dehydratase family protein [Vibrio sp.]
MKIVITGANGFIGKNLVTMLKENQYDDLILITRETTEDELKSAILSADFIYHLAGINRPQDPREFEIGNKGLTEVITNYLQSADKPIPIVFTSSTQAVKDNDYGLSKNAAELSVKEYAKQTHSDAYIYRLPNVFGKWCKPNYNSFVATFCYNTANDLDIQINDPNAPVTLVYIDDVCKEFISLLGDDLSKKECKVEPEYQTTVGYVAQKLKMFKESKQHLISEPVGTGFTRALYSTYLSYFTPDQFSYTVPRYGDERGVFSEMLKTKDSGQFSFFTAHSGITRGGHYHHTKNEKFLVLSGKAEFKFEHILTGERFSLVVDGAESRIVETVPGWSHDVTNIGDSELVVMLWANEIFDREAPDTFSKPLQ